MKNLKTDIQQTVKNIISRMQDCTLDEKVDILNAIKTDLHAISPFKNEPVDCVLWIKNDNVVSNDYNPNKVAPPEMELLEVSIMNDGYTQPIVAWNNPEKGKTEVIDGFHRNRVGKESPVVNQRVMGYLPIVDIRKEQSNKNDRIASTIRHNRARGKHQVDAMSEIVLELKNRNWKNSRIARELGMDEDEILRLCQISGLQEMFLDDDFNKSWDSSDSIAEYEPITDDILREEVDARTVNTSDPDRIFHTFDLWECHKAGFYASTKDGMTKDQCEQAYADFLSNDVVFEAALIRVIGEWKYSCEHYLTNKAMNRIAWLGQAAVCIDLGIPSKYCGGFNRLTQDKQETANELALKYLNKWFVNNDRKKIEMDEALSIGRQSNIY